MRILVSACLLGMRCRYDGESKACPAVLSLKEHHQLVPVCPEQLGGLPTPRPACERVGDRVMTGQGEDRTAEYARGAEQAARLYTLLDCDCAVLKSRSPMCGAGEIHDGSFSGGMLAGDGCLAALLKQAGVPVFTEEQTDSL